MRRRLPATTTLLALGIGVTAGALRFWRVSWGLPGQMGFPDELVIFNPYAPAFARLSWASFAQQKPLYPTLYGYLLGLTSNLVHTFGVSAEPLGAASPATFIVGRAISAAMGVVTVGVVGLSASRMYSRRVGFAAAALMAVVPFHVMYSHIASTDLTLTAWAAVTVALAYATATGGKTRTAGAGGFAAGLAFATKYTGLEMLVAVGWATAERAARDGVARGVVLGFVALLGFAAAVTLACPPCVFNSAFMLAGMQTLRAQTSVFAEGATNNHLVPSLGWYGRPYLYQLAASLPFSLGWPLYALTVSGVVVAVARREIADRVILVTVASYFVVVAASRVTFPRYLMPLFPGLVILAARGGWALPGPGWLRGAAIGAVWVYSLAFGASQVARFSFDQQRDVARWIRGAVPAQVEPGTIRVGVPLFILDYFRLGAPLLAEGFKQVQLKDGHWFDDPTDFFVLPEWYEIAIERDKPNTPVAADLAHLRSGTAGYRRAEHWSSSYLQRGLYTALDPGFATDLWQGEIGFTVYVREPPRTTQN